MSDVCGDRLCRTLGVVALVAWGAFTSQALAQPPTPETPMPDSQAATPTASFRPGHNLTLLAAGQQSSWKVRRAGEVRDVAFQSWEPGALLRYKFHLNLVSKFGIVLGTGVGAWWQNRTYAGFRPGGSIMFPSIVVGIVQNFRADGRILLFGEYSANWYPWMTARGAPATDATEGGRETRVAIAPIPDAFSVVIQLDVFSGRNTALTAATGWRVVSNELFGKPSKNTLLGNSSFRNTGVFIASGVTWTLGDELGR